MAHIDEWADGPIEITLGERKLKVRRLSLEDVFSSVRARIKQEHVQNMIDISGNLTGEDKIEYLRRATQDINAGEDIEKAVAARLGNEQGVKFMFYLAMRKDQPDMTEEEVNEMLSSYSDIETVTGLCEWLTGVSTSGSWEKKMVPMLINSSNEAPA